MTVWVGGHAHLDTIKQETNKTLFTKTDSSSLGLRFLTPQIG